MSELATELPEPDPTLSSDAADSTYEAAEQPEQFPPLGTASVQTLGKPGSGGAPAKSKSSSSSSSSSSS